MKTLSTFFVTTVAIAAFAVSANAAPAKTDKKKEDTKAPATTSSTTPSAPALATDKSARVIMLDKQTNRKQVLVIGAGEPQTLGTLQVKLTKCMPDYQGVLGQDVAWLDITESAEGGARSGPWFSGWMFNTYPEVSTMDHPRYDVQIQGCGSKARQIIQTSGSAPVLDAAAPEDTESAGDQPATDGTTDPYVVPGVKDETTTAAPAATEIPAEQPAQEEPPEQTAPVAQPVESTPAAEQPQEDTPNDLHKMMDSGQY